jgi:undecaprenyl diphosphate synthase
MTKEQNKTTFRGDKDQRVVLGSKRIEGAPKHVAIICDGNRTWAKERGMKAFEGHKKGADNSLKLLERGVELGVEYVTLWGWSTENWKREKDEIKFLMKLFIKLTRKMKDKFLDNDIRFKHLGRDDRLPKKLIDVFHDLEEKTKLKSAATFSIALDYGSQDEILRAVKNIVADGVDPDNITTELFDSYLDTADIAPPDMIIRTGGKKRLSGFLMWQSVYSELFFVDEKFPEFSPDQLEELVREYTSRKRTFGGNVKNFSYTE